MSWNMFRKARAVEPLESQFAVFVTILLKFFNFIAEAYIYLLNTTQTIHHIFVGAKESSSCSHIALYSTVNCKDDAFSICGLEGGGGAGCYPPDVP